MICTPHDMLFDEIKKNDSRGMYYIWGKLEVHTGLRLGTLQEKDHSEDLDVDRRIILNVILKQQDGIGLSGLRMGAGGRLL